MERIGADWRMHVGHTERYVYAAKHTLRFERVNDIACGIGYGSTFFDPTVYYNGFDKPGIPNPTFRGSFLCVDLDDPLWKPETADVTVCFETLEHLRSPREMAAKIAASTRRAIFVSVPTVPTKHFNPYHLHDFTVDEVPPMFPGFKVKECWEQPAELAHVWYLTALPKDRDAWGYRY